MDSRELLSPEPVRIFARKHKSCIYAFVVRLAAQCNISLHRNDTRSETSTIKIFAIRYDFHVVVAFFGRSQEHPSGTPAPFVFGGMEPGQKALEPKTKQKDGAQG